MAFRPKQPLQNELAHLIGTSNISERRKYVTISWIFFLNFHDKHKDKVEKI
jgi:hypothetical protein